MRLDEQIEALQEPGESMRVSTITIVSFAVFYMRRSIQRAGAATRYGRKVRTLIDIKTFKNSKNNRFFGKCSDPLTCCDWQLIFRLLSVGHLLKGAAHVHWLICRTTRNPCWYRPIMAY